MNRNLILTPYQAGFITGFGDGVNQTLAIQKREPIDLSYLLLSATTMAGVDNIFSIKKVESSFIKKEVSEKQAEKWAKSVRKVDNAVSKYNNGSLSEEDDEELRHMGSILGDLAYAMETNTGMLIFSELNKYSYKLPIELRVLTEILFKSIQKTEASLPIVQMNVEKKDIQRLLDIMASKEFTFYKEAQSEINSNDTVSDKMVKNIEKTAQQLYRKNSKILSLKEGIIETIPFSASIVELFFGKLPGIFTEYVAKKLTSKSNSSKSITLYNCRPVLNEVIRASLP